MFIFQILAENPKTALPLQAFLHLAKQFPWSLMSKPHVQQENILAQPHTMSLQNRVRHNRQTKPTRHCLPHHQHEQRWILTRTLSIIDNAQINQLALLRVQLRWGWRGVVLIQLMFYITSWNWLKLILCCSVVGFSFSAKWLCGEQLTRGGAHQCISVLFKWHFYRSRWGITAM